MTSIANDNRRGAANDNNPYRFYVYCWRYPEGYTKSGPFYIGKGGGHARRDVVEAGRNTHFKRIVGKIRREGFEPVVERLQNGLLEADSLRLEKAYIALFGRSDLGSGVLCNLTDGGDGLVGHVPSAETRKKMSDARKGMELTAETRKKISHGNTGKKYTAETCAKISVALKGKKPTAETCEKIRVALTGRTLPDEEREKITIASQMRPPLTRAFKGTYPHGKKWRAVINIGGTEYKLGSFLTPEEAAKAWDAVAFKTRPNGTYLNFPEEYGLPPNDTRPRRPVA